MKSWIAGMTLDWSLTKLSVVKGGIVTVVMLVMNYLGLIPTGLAIGMIMGFWLGLGIGRDDDSEVVSTTEGLKKTAMRVTDTLPQ